MDAARAVAVEAMSAAQLTATRVLRVFTGYLLFWVISGDRAVSFVP
jgi:hypothetical protein